MPNGPYALLSNAELAAVFSRKRERIAAEFADYFAIIGEVDTRPGFVPGARPGAEAKTLLRAVGVENPDEDVRIARVLHELPQLAEALSVGEASRGHVKIAARAIGKIRAGDAAALEGRMAEVDTRLSAAARDLDPGAFRSVTERLVAHLHPNAGDLLDERAADRCEVVIWDDAHGRTGIKGYLPADAGARLRAVLDRWAKPHPAREADVAGGLPIYDPRSKRERQADALSIALGLALGAATKTEPDRPHVVIHIRHDSPGGDGEQTGLLSRAWVGRLLCDATVARLVQGREGEVLEQGRKVRTVTPAQRRALIGRDRTCIIPNCTVPARWADAHHVQWWSKGGPTNVSNLAMLCGPHHTAVHTGTWTLEMRNGIPWVKPPKWLDPHQHWRRNTYGNHCRAAEQLALDIHPPDTS